MSCVQGDLLMDAWHTSRYTGLFQRSGPVPLMPHDPAIPLWFGTVTPWGPRRQTLPVGGAGWDRDAAEWAGLGEAIERLQPYPLPCDQVIEASYAEWPLDEPAIQLDCWILFHPEQYAQPGFPYRPLTPSTRCRWVCFRRHPQGTPCWVPEDLAFLYPRDGRHAICPAVSTGLSCGQQGQPVLLRGLQEVIERDAVMGCWWDRYPLEERNASAMFDFLGASVSECLIRPNLRYRFYRVASPFSAHVTIVTVQGEEEEGFCFSAGSACRETRRASWLKAILEAVQGLHYARYLKRERRQSQTAPGAELSDFPDHALYYSLHPEQLPRTVFHRAGNVLVNGQEAAPEDCAALLERLGPDRPVLFRNLTPPGIAQEVGTWYVLKVLVPGLQPLHGNDRYPHLGGPLWAPRGLKDWASLPPHPFP
jgi:ribosomal protein S12 methylthiotransferase accessory factor